MRKHLKSLDRTAQTFRGTVERFGRDGSSYGGYQTILLKQIKTENQSVTNHLWFDIEPFYKLHMCCGDYVEFEAGVTIYEKGYQGNSIELMVERPVELDYGLDNPTTARLVACAYPRGGKR